MADTNELEPAVAGDEEGSTEGADSTIVQWIEPDGGDRRAETLEEVAARLGVDAGALFDANRGLIGSTPDNVTAGMRLELPR